MPQCIGMIKFSNINNINSRLYIAALIFNKGSVFSHKCVKKLNKNLDEKVGLNPGLSNIQS